jgi:DNA repair protein RadC
VPRKDTNELAHTLLKKYGSLSAVFEAEPHDLAKTPGMGMHSAIMLSIIPSVARVYLKNKWGDRPRLCNTTEAGKYLISLFAGEKYEAFYLICLDAQNRVNYNALIHEGTIDQAAIYPRIIVEAAIRHQAYSVILAHNHPGGSINPSLHDIETTKEIVNALKTIAVAVMDHVIVAGDQFYSFAENELI